MSVYLELVGMDPVHYLIYPTQKDTTDHSKLMISGIVFTYTIDDDWSIQSKHWPVVSRAKVGTK